MKFINLLGAELDSLSIPVGGDQMTCVKLQSAKGLRAGCHTAVQRLEHMHPIIVELFHTSMDFLQVFMIKRTSLTCAIYQFSQIED